MLPNFNCFLRDFTPKFYSLAGIEDFATVSASVLAPKLMHQLHVGPQTHLENNSFSMMITYRLLPSRRAKEHLVSKLLAAEVTSRLVLASVVAHVAAQGAWITALLA